MVEEAADAHAALSSPVVPVMPAPATAEVAAVPVEGCPVAASAGMADASAPKTSEEVGAVAQPVPPGDSLSAVRRSPEARRPLLRFRTREASDPVFVLDDEQEDQSWGELRECAEATVGSLRASLVRRDDDGVAPGVAGGFLQRRPQNPPGSGFGHPFFPSV